MTGKLIWRDLQVRAVEVPLRRPVISKVGLFDKIPLILLDLETEQGIVGRSYIVPYLTSAVHYLVPVLRDLGAAQKGRPVAPFDSYGQGRKALGLLGLEGMSLTAVSAIDMAAWDASAKAAGQPLAVYLGGSLGPVPTYNSNGLWLRPLEGMEEEAAALAAERGGFSAMKLRMGRDRLADDLRAIEAVRRGAGDSITIMTDFNQGRTLGDALSRCRALDGEGLYWFEEPIAYDKFQGYARLSGVLKTPVMLGENFYGPETLARAIAERAGDYMMFDLARIGGVTGWLRSAAIAGVHGIQVSSHFYPEFSAHLLRVTETAHWLEMIDWAEPVLEEPFRVENGQCVVPDVPGVGIVWDERAIERYRLDV